MGLHIFSLCGVFIGNQYLDLQVNFKNFNILFLNRKSLSFRLGGFDPPPSPFKQENTASHPDQRVLNPWSTYWRSLIKRALPTELQAG